MHIIIMLFYGTIILSEHILALNSASAYFFEVPFTAHSLTSKCKPMCQFFAYHLLSDMHKLYLVKIAPDCTILIVKMPSPVHIWLQKMYWSC